MMIQFLLRSLDALWTVERDREKVMSVDARVLSALRPSDTAHGGSDARARGSNLFRIWAPPRVERSIQRTSITLYEFRSSKTQQRPTALP